jgi:hypothetical protein
MPEVVRDKSAQSAFLRRLRQIRQLRRPLQPRKPIANIVHRERG